MSSSAGMLIIYVVAFIAIFYFLAIRPQQRQRRAHQTLLASLKKGDQIVTAAGMYGTVKRIEESVVVVEIAKGVTIKIARNAVAQIIRDKQEARAVAPEPRRRGADAEMDEASDEVEGVEAVVDETEEVVGEEMLEPEEPMKKRARTVGGETAAKVSKRQK